MGKIQEHSKKLSEFLKLIKEAEGDDILGGGLGGDDATMPPADNMGTDTSLDMGTDAGMGTGTDTTTTPPPMQEQPPVAPQPLPAALPPPPPPVDNGEEVDITELIDGQEEQKKEISTIRTLLSTYKKDIDSIGDKVSKFINGLGDELKAELVKRLPTADEKGQISIKMTGGLESPEDYFNRKREEQEQMYKDLASPKYNVRMVSNKGSTYKIDDATVDSLMGSKTLNPFKF